MIYLQGSTLRAGYCHQDQMKNCSGCVNHYIHYGRSYLKMRVTHQALERLKNHSRMTTMYFVAILQGLMSSLAIWQRLLTRASERSHQVTWRHSLSI